jgi:hypothetical protein
MSRTPDVEGVQRRHSVEVEREASIMALYVTICLLAALAAVPDGPGSEHDHAVKLIWGTTIGLAITHWFAFRLAAAARPGHEDAKLALAQLAGAVAVALLTTVTMLLVRDSAELDVVRVELALIIGASGYLTARDSGAGRHRALVFAVVMTVVALGIATLKNHLVGH